MAKSPEPGHVKTRLVPPLNAVQAAQLYACFLVDTIDLVRALVDWTPGLQPVIAYAPPQAQAYFAQRAPDFDLVLQRGPDLASRLASIMATYLETFDQVVAISSDTPTMPAGEITHAYSALADPAVDAVFGPCDDGGYYLIGLDYPHLQLIQNVRMSTQTVMRDTLAIARANQIAVRQLAAWYDVDTVEDLQRLSHDLLAHSRTRAVQTRRFLTTIAALIDDSSAT